MKLFLRACSVLLLLFAGTVVADLLSLNRYQDLALRFSREYEEVAPYSLMVEELKPLWNTMQGRSLGGLVSWFSGKQLSVEPNCVVDRLLARIYGRGNMPRLGSYAYRFLPFHKDNTIIAIGYTGGSFYSLVQILLDMEARGIIDNDLKIKDDNTYIVFTGDYSSPSPYWLYSLHLLASMMEQNPQHCIVLRGRNERLAYWEGFNTVRAYLKTLAEGFTDDEVPFSGELNAFYNGLPDALVLRSKSGQKVFFSNHLLPHQDVGHPEVCSLISGRSFSDHFTSNTEGFDFCRFRSGVASWQLFSAPDFVVSHQMSGYLEIRGAKDFEKLVGVYRYAPRNTLGIPFSESSYALAYGFELHNEKDLERLADSKREFVCATVDLSGGTALVGNSLSSGVEVVLCDANERGLCAPILFRHVVFDDRYTPKNAQANIAAFRKEYGASYVLAPQGSPTLSAYIDLVRNKELAVLFSESGATQFRSPDLPYIINLRPSFEREVDQMLAYLFNRFNITKFAAVYQDDAFGVPLLEATKSFLGKHASTTIFDQIGYVRGQASFIDVNELIKKSNSLAIAYYITSSASAQGFFGGDMAVFLKGRRVLLVLVDESITKVLKRFGVAAIYSSSVPDPHASSLPFVVKYREIFQEQNRFLSVHSLLGFVSGKLFVDGVIRLNAQKKPLNGAEFVSLYQGYQGVDLLGLSLSFDPSIRSFNLPVWIHQEDDTWIMGVDGGAMK